MFPEVVWGAFWRATLSRLLRRSFRVSLAGHRHHRGLHDKLCFPGGSVNHEKGPSRAHHIRFGPSCPPRDASLHLFARLAILARLKPFLALGATRVLPKLVRAFAHGAARYGYAARRAHEWPIYVLAETMVPFGALATTHDVFAVTLTAVSVAHPTAPLLTEVFVPTVRVEFRLFHAQASVPSGNETKMALGTLLLFGRRGCVDTRVAVVYCAWGTHPHVVGQNDNVKTVLALFAAHTVGTASRDTVVVTSSALASPLELVPLACCTLTKGSGSADPMRGPCERQQ